MKFIPPIVAAGVIEVFVDGAKYGELRDDTIYLTLPELAQLKAKGKKITFRQVTDSGEILDQNPSVLPPYMVVESSFSEESPSEDALLNSVYTELQGRYFFQLLMPEIVFVKTDAFLGNTVFDPACGRVQVQLHDALRKAPELLRQVLAHELIHAYLYQKYGEDVARHGEHFDFMAYRINQDNGENYVAQFGETTRWKFDSPPNS